MGKYNKSIAEQETQLNLFYQVATKKQRRYVYFREKKRIKTKGKSERKRTKEIETSKHLYRYSVAYFSRPQSMDKTFRAEVVTNEKRNSKRMIIILTHKLKQWIDQSKNKGMQRAFSRSRFNGIESEEIGVNDIGSNQLNRIYTFLE